MIKVANNIARMLEKRSAATPVPSQDDIFYNENLGGFHARGQLPESMLPEYYQELQARSLLNPGRITAARYASTPQELAMALNTGFVPGMVQAYNSRGGHQIDNMGRTPVMQGDYVRSNLRPRSEIFSNTNQDNFSEQAKFMEEQGLRFGPQSLNVPRQSLPGATNASHFFGAYNPQHTVDGFRFGAPFQHAAYDVTPDNPQGITGYNRESAQTVANLANKPLEQMNNARRLKEMPTLSLRNHGDITSQAREIQKRMLQQPMQQR